MCSISERLWRCALIGVLALGGCLRESTSHCDNGSVCPAGLRCGTVGDTPICVAPTCGNGRLDRNEACDDGNNVSGDGCPASCSTPCADGVLDPGEECDDANTTDGDGCDHDCTATACGNGIVVGEACDDGNAIDGDSCDHNCTVTACGNGVVTEGEACDDGNATDRDGCDLGCTLTCFPEHPSFAISPGSILLVPVGAAVTVDFAFTNHNPLPCVPIPFSLRDSFLFEGEANGLALEPPPFTTVVSAPLATGTTGHLTIIATASDDVTPGTRFDVSVLVQGGTLFELETLSFTIAPAVATEPR